MHKVEINGEEVEVYTAAEKEAEVAAARAAVEGEYKPKLDDLSGKLTEAEKAAAQRAVEFGQFRKLSDDQVKQLNEKDAIIYANQLAFQAERERFAAADEAAYTNARDAIIKKQTAGDPKLFEEVKKMYELVNLTDDTPETMENRVKIAFGAVAQTQPDLLALAGFTGAGGSFEPPKVEKEGDTTFADTPAGKTIAKQLGLDVPEKK